MPGSYSNVYDDLYNIKNYKSKGWLNGPCKTVPAKHDGDGCWL